MFIENKLKGIKKKKFDPLGGNVRLMYRSTKNT